MAIYVFCSVYRLVGTSHKTAEMQLASSACWNRYFPILVVLPMILLKISLGQ